MIRGTVVWVDLSDTSPPELGKKRPAIVLSNSYQNSVLDTIVVVPVSSKPPEIPPLRIKLAPVKNAKGFAIIPGIRQIKKSRILKAVGAITREDQEKLDEAITLYLSD